MIEGKKQHPDKQKTDELPQHDRAARQQRCRRPLRSICAQVSLYQILVRPVGAHGQEAAAD
jgi:hypothetical protein